MPSHYIQSNCRLQVMSPVVTVTMSGIVHSSEYGLQESFQHKGNYIPKRAHSGAIQLENYKPLQGHASV